MRAELHPIPSSSHSFFVSGGRTGGDATLYHEAGLRCFLPGLQGIHPSSLYLLPGYLMDILRRRGKRGYEAFLEALEFYYPEHYTRLTGREPAQRCSMILGKGRRCSHGKGRKSVPVHV